MQIHSALSSWYDHYRSKNGVVWRYNRNSQSCRQKCCLNVIERCQANLSKFVAICCSAIYYSRCVNSFSQLTLITTLFANIIFVFTSLRAINIKLLSNSLAPCVCLEISVIVFIKSPNGKISRLCHFASVMLMFRMACICENKCRSSFID